MAHLVLKPRFSLVGKGLLPMILEFRTSDNPVELRDLARLKKDHPLENYSLEELSTEFRKLTGETLKDVILLTGRDLNLDNAQQLMHQAILFANLVGGPKGSLLRDSQSGATDNAEQGPSGSSSRGTGITFASGNAGDAVIRRPILHTKGIADATDMEARMKKMEQNLDTMKQKRASERVDEVLKNVIYGVPRVWKPAFSCFLCDNPNDEDTKFCQSCGTKLINEDELVSPVDFVTEERLRFLDNLMDDAQYRKKTSSLEKEFSLFLLNYSRNLITASPDDVGRFLVHKDKKGKTQIHNISCVNLGKSGVFDCGCPLRLSSGTVQTILGQLKGILESYGKGKEWDEKKGFGNPVSSLKVKRYLEAIKREQAASHSVVKQAKPVFFDKLKSISIFIDSKLLNAKTVSEKFTLLRDQAFFKLQFFAGDRASDLGRSLTQEVKRLQDDSGFVFTHTVGKTLKNGRKNEFSIMRIDDHSVCPVHGIEKYISGSAEMGVDLRVGYLFRTLDRKRKHVLEVPVTHSVMYSRLKNYLRELGIDEGETPHSFRGGCAITLAVSGYALLKI